MHQAFLSFTISWSLLRFMSIESMMLYNHLILCPLLLLPSIFPSNRFGVFVFVFVFLPSELALHIRRPKDWSFSLSISPSNKYLGLVSFRIDWSDFFEIQGTQESSPVPQFESINLSGLSFLCGPTLTSIAGKTIALTMQTFVGIVNPLLFNMLSKFVIGLEPTLKSG